MRSHGTLAKWNDDRGFGFVALPNSHEEVFVHISAFPRDSVRPRIGETVTFEVQVSPDGRKRAVAIERPGSRKTSKRHETRARRTSTRLSITSLISGIAVLAFGLVGYGAYRAAQQGTTETPSIKPFAEPASTEFRCDRRTRCSQMTSCAEAEYFLKHCPGTQMDGNGDGEPCEQQWCN